jgi:hypothetical protein
LRIDIALSRRRYRRRNLITGATMLPEHAANCSVANRLLQRLPVLWLVRRGVRG